MNRGKEKLKRGIWLVEKKLIKIFNPKTMRENTEIK